MPSPVSPAARDTWVLAQRGQRPALDPRRPFAFFVEDERAEAGGIIPVATVFLTNRECPWRCVFCDLWKNTLEGTVPAGAIPAQIGFALERLPQTRQIKLYNSGSFFDSRAIPPADWPEIAARIRGFDRVIVECHPALVGESVVQFGDLIETKLEVAMGLETVHPEVLPKLNKRMTLDQFKRAAEFLRENQIALRVFVLVKPPFLDEGQGIEWAKRSIDFAFDAGATVVSLIPTRPGNGALDALAAQGQFAPPRLTLLEAALDYGIGLGRGRVFADVWDLEIFSRCAKCFPARRERLRKMNLSQTVLPRPVCEACGEADGC